MRVAAVVLNHGNWPGVGLTLESLLGQSRAPDRVILVDNASEHLPVDEVGRSFPDVELIVSRRNRGYGGGMNLGIAQVRPDADAYLLVTHECALEPDVVMELAGHLERDPSVAVAAPLLAYQSRRDVVWAAGGGLDEHTWQPYRLGWGDPVDAWTGRQPMHVTWADGACWMIRATAFEEAGRLDEDYFLYYEDTTYGIRLRELGWEIVCIPGVVAYQEPSDAPVYLGVRSGLRFVARTAPREQLHRLIRVFVRDIWHRLRRGERRLPFAKAAGLVAFLVGSTGPTPRFLMEPRDHMRPPGDAS